MTHTTTHSQLNIVPFWVQIRIYFMGMKWHRLAMVFPTCVSRMIVGLVKYLSIITVETTDNVIQFGDIVAEAEAIVNGSLELVAA